MTKNTVLNFWIFFCCCLFTACNTATPERYFDLAVLNCNMITNFSDDGLVRELESPSMKLAEGTKDQAAPMKRKEVIDTKIHFLEENLHKLKDLKETPDTKEMLQTSITLNEFVLPVLKTEYQQLAKLYDEGASKEATQSLALAIHNKYFPRFNELFTKLMGIGKSYAERHDIKVNWGN